MKIFQKIVICISLLIGLLAAGSAYAGLVPCGLSADDPGSAWNETDKCTLCHFWNLASNLINFISFSLAIPIAVVLIIVAGGILMFSGGNQDKVALAKTILTNTIIGLLIIFCSWLLIDTLVQSVASRDTTEGVIVWAWNEFPVCPVIPVTP